MDRFYRAIVVTGLTGALQLGALAAAPEGPYRIRPLDATGLVSYFIADGADGSRFRPGDRQLAEWALQEWERSAGGLLRFEPAAPEKRALLRFSWLPWAADASMGRMEPSSIDGHAGAVIMIRPDEQRFRPSIRRGIQHDPLVRDAVLYYVCLHEIGHALGLSHSRNPVDVMWPGNNGVTLPVYERYRHRLQSRGDIPRTSWLSPNDIARFQALWRHGPLAQ